MRGGDFLSRVTWPEEGRAHVTFVVPSLPAPPPHLPSTCSSLPLNLFPELRSQGCVSPWRPHIRPNLDRGTLRRWIRA